MRVDHLVWYCADLAEGERYFAERMDHGSAYGGVHPGEGTRNRLLSLSDTTYVEILGRDPAQPETSLAAEVRGLKGFGLYHWAIGGIDLAGCAGRPWPRALPAASSSAVAASCPTAAGWAGPALVFMITALARSSPSSSTGADSSHPAKTAPRGGSLGAVAVASPAARELREIYRNLGLDIPVHEAPSPGLSVTLESTKGNHVLSMFNPVPRGYVI